MIFNTPLVVGTQIGLPTLANTIYVAFACVLSSNYSTIQGTNYSIAPCAFEIDIVRGESSILLNAGESYVFTLQCKTGDDSPVDLFSMTWTNSSKLVTSTVRSQINAGDKVWWKIVSTRLGSKPPTCTISISARCTTTGNFQPLFGSSYTVVNPGLTRYVQIGNGSTPTLTETNIIIMFPTSGTIRSIYVSPGDGISPGTATLTLRTGTMDAMSDTGLSVTTSNGTASNTIDPPGSRPSVSKGTVASLKYVTSVDATPSLVAWGIVWVPNVADEAIFINYAYVNSRFTFYISWFCSLQSGGSSNEVECMMWYNTNFKLKNLCVLGTVNPSPGPGSTIIVRRGLLDTDVALNITSGNYTVMQESTTLVEFLDFNGYQSSIKIVGDSQNAPTTLAFLISGIQYVPRNLRNSSTTSTVNIPPTIIG